MLPYSLFRSQNQKLTIPPILQCKIDLQKNVLHIGTTGTETKFLPENELPSHSRLSGNDDDEATAAALKSTADELEASEIRKAIEKSRQELGSALGAAAAGASSSGASGSGFSAPPATAASNDNFTESDIAEIQKLGFTRDKIILELRNANGNKTQAVAALFAKSIKF